MTDFDVVRDFCEAPGRLSRDGKRTVLKDRKRVLLALARIEADNARLHRIEAAARAVAPYLTSEVAPGEYRCECCLWEEGRGGVRVPHEEGCESAALRTALEGSEG